MSRGKPGSKESALHKKGTESETVGRKQRCTEVGVPAGGARRPDHPPARPEPARAVPLAPGGRGTRRWRRRRGRPPRTRPRSPRLSRRPEAFPGRAEGATRDRPAAARTLGGRPAGGARRAQREDGARGRRPQRTTARRSARRGGGTCGPEREPGAAPPLSKGFLPGSPARDGHAVEAAVPAGAARLRPPARPALTRLSCRLSGTGLPSVFGGSMGSCACAPGRQPCWCGAEVAPRPPPAPPLSAALSGRCTWTGVGRCGFPGPQKRDALSRRFQQDGRKTTD